MTAKLLPPLVALLALPSLAPAQPVPGERYYMTLFGAQAVPYRNSYTHTFAVFTRTVPTAAGEAVAESHTVSWMPAALRIRFFALRPEPGVNLSLPDTFDWVASFNGRVSGWGPYEIGADRYFPAVQRKADLEGGAYQYRSAGGVFRSSHVLNCGQAFSRADPVLGRFHVYPTPGAGETGTTYLARRYRRTGAFVQPDVTHPGLVPVIGADRYPVTWRQPGEPVPPVGRR